MTIENPYNERDFQDDKLSIVDVKAIDQRGAIYHVEVQLETCPGLIKRIVFYGCEMYADQLRAGQEYAKLRPTFSICLVNGVVWKDADRLHHVFELTDRQTGRTLDSALAIHMLELGRYNLGEADLCTASLLDSWLYWLLNAHRYGRDDLWRLFPHAAMREASETICRIAEITEDKAMYDAREKAIRDREWALKESFLAGEAAGLAKGEAAGLAKGEEAGLLLGTVKGKIELIQTLQQILREPISVESELNGLGLSRLEEIAAALQQRIRLRHDT